MALGLILTVAAIIGIIYGKKNKNQILVITSAILLAVIAAIGIYFFKDPY